MSLSLHVFEPRYRQLVADLLSGSDNGAPEFGVVALRQGWEVGDLKDLHEIGTTARVTDVVPMPDGRCNLAAIGERRFQIVAVDTASRPYLLAQVRYLAEQDGDVGPALVAAVRSALLQHRRALTELGVADAAIEVPTDAAALPYAIAQHPALPMSDRQLILAGEDTGKRLRICRNVLRREYQLLRYLRAVPATAAAFASGAAFS